MSYRKDKLESLLQEEMSSIFLMKLKDPAFSLITVTKVRISPDLKIAKTYISVYDKPKRDTVLEKLKEIKGFIRSELAQRVKMRFVPDLQFYIDDTLDYVEKMENLFRQIHKDGADKHHDDAARLGAEADNPFNQRFQWSRLFSSRRWTERR